MKIFEIKHLKISPLLLSPKNKNRDAFKIKFLSHFILKKLLVGLFYILRKVTKKTQIVAVAGKHGFSLRL